MSALSTNRIHISDYATVVVKPLDAKIKEMLVQLMTHIEVPSHNFGSHMVSHSHSRGGDISRNPRSVGKNNYLTSSSGTKKSSEVLRKGIKGPQEVRDIPLDNWEAIRNFKATKMETKLGVDKIMSEVRILINKLSASNAAQQKGRIMDIVREYYSNSEMLSSENTNTFVCGIFDIVCGNKMLSDVYASMYADLIKEHADFNVPIQSFADTFIHSEIPPYIDPEENYDGYCLYNKTMDKRKSSLCFAISCMKINLIYKADVSKMIMWLIEQAKILIDTPRNEKVVEELADMTYIVLDKGYAELSVEDDWQAIVSEIEVLSCKKAKSAPSISNRSIFKYKDIMDIVKKRSVAVSK